ncbi:MerR family transcriptional regulator [Roseibaca sp. Y0-43]|uniref:MerR family transcriptional regulator n=1 Tax=Roseibaca sp. Y0-43 TaxID=2816854 RepID=UPI001D0C7AA2|nr:MerR family transcriptional regulator [Roseibaca sp. Y0-43]MCC1481514.1 MerR family transcriptional regulator [Roseibaca sp. Y0-43]
MRKAPEAFRTISEAADALETPAHVLRFWESKFTQVKPVKRAGGRRYYRPADIDLLSGIKMLLHEQGMTIRGVQKLLQEKGARHVAAMAPLSGEVVEDSAAPVLTLVPKTPAPKAEDVSEIELPAADVAPAAPQPADKVESAGEATPEPEADIAGEDATPVAAEDGAQSTAQDLPPAASVPESEPDDTRPAPALAALLDAAAEGAPAQPLRFSAIAHALRTNPPKAPEKHARALARLEALVAKISARAD